MKHLILSHISPQHAFFEPGSELKHLVAPAFKRTEHPEHPDSTTALRRSCHGLRGFLERTPES
jgi:hypothetical protein